MHNQILKKLPQIEQTHQIKLLYVAESGSRAWGFALRDPLIISPKRNHV
ncbi:DNA polymerase beta superfamily protein [Proteus mirabilis]|nr:nucleotidyltransferase domain-containing protein [Proteus mirabilis]